MPGGQQLTVALVPATTADLPRLAEYMRGLRADDPMPAGTLADDETTTAAVSALLSNPALGRAWLIHADGSATGYAVLTFIHSIEFGGRCAFVDELYLEPAARGQGIGRRTMELLGEAAVSDGVRVLLLEASPENERACRLYRAAGFDERKYRLMSKRLQRPLTVSAKE